MFSALLNAAVGDVQEALAKLQMLRISNASAGAGPIKTVIAYVLTIFVLFLFATSGLINNANIQTQLKNGAYYAGLFSGLVSILIAIDFLGL
jgi:NADH:ubiquinone oxidoreductase subunit 6 (subunit J)